MGITYPKNAKKTIRSIAVRETTYFINLGAQSRAPLRPSQHYRTDGFTLKGAPNIGPQLLLPMEKKILSVSECICSPMELLTGIGHRP